jgi:hypothetical protein
MPGSAGPVRGFCEPSLAQLGSGRAAWAVASRRFCRSRIDANEKPAVESNLSLRMPRR